MQAFSPRKGLIQSGSEVSYVGKPTSESHAIACRLGGDGDRSALAKLLVEGELYQLAHRYMRHERQGHTLQTTALVNEAYLTFIIGR